MLGFASIAGGIAMFAGALYLRRTMPWPFKYEGQKFRRMPDGSFQDAGKTTVHDVALIPKLEEAYKRAKYTVETERIGTPVMTSDSATVACANWVV